MLACSQMLNKTLALPKAKAQLFINFKLNAAITHAIMN